MVNLSKDCYNSREMMKGDVHMLRIAICDDETKARDALRFQLEKIIDEETEEIVYEFSSGINAEKWLR